MKLLNKAGERSFISWLFLAVFLITAPILGTSCGSGDPQNNQGGGQPMPIPSTAPTVDPLLAAQTNFKDEIWTKFLLHPRCANCHDFEAQRTTIYAGHPNPPPPFTDGDSARCTGCHKPGDPPAGLLGFPGWVQAPIADKWNSASSDSNVIRAHILLAGPTTGVNLYKHLCGSGPDKAPLVQWAFFNGPDTGSGAGQIHAGVVPPGGLHHPTGQITLAEPDMLDWHKFCDIPPFPTLGAVPAWMCLEKKIPGAPDLGLPPTVVCP